METPNSDKTFRVFGWIAIGAFAAYVAYKVLPAILVFVLIFVWLVYGMVTGMSACDGGVDGHTSGMTREEKIACQKKFPDHEFPYSESIRNGSIK